MAVLIVSTLNPDVPREMVQDLSRRMGVNDNPPDGLIVHTSTEKNGQIEVYDVWESEEQFNSFMRDRLGPAMQEMVRERGMEPPTEGPQQEVREIFEMVRGRS